MQAVACAGDSTCQDGISYPTERRLDSLPRIDHGILQARASGYTSFFRLSRNRFPRRIQKAGSVKTSCLLGEGLSHSREWKEIYEVMSSSTTAAEEGPRPVLINAVTYDRSSLLPLSAPRSTISVNLLQRLSYLQHSADGAD
jgi:hypothetical protein